MLLFSFGLSSGSEREGGLCPLHEHPIYRNHIAVVRYHLHPSDLSHHVVIDVLLTLKNFNTCLVAYWHFACEFLLLDVFLMLHLYSCAVWELFF